MKKLLRIFVATCFIICGGTVKAQNDIKEIMSPHVFTPNAAEIGKYGKVPVSYFSGLPDITIPLTELHAKDFDLPVYLTYYAGGNRPETHPGWTGLGWTLHAGGCINRICNGIEDEATNIDAPLSSSNGIGCLATGSSLQNGSWQSNTLRPILASANLYDYAPDEFQINVDGIQASFYIYDSNNIRVVSKGATDFTAQITTNSNIKQLNLIKGGRGEWPITAPAYSFIERIDITADDGTKYTFGGDTTAIEFSIVQRSKYGDNVYHQWGNLNELNTFVRANSWMLTKIEKPYGEIVEFQYEHDGIPVIRTDVHHMEAHELADINENTRVEGSYYRFPNVGLSFILPCYLKEIKSKIGGDSLVFHRSKSRELRYDYTEDEIHWVIGNYEELLHYGPGGTSMYESIRARDYYMQLDKIIGCRKEVDLTYTSDTTKRLKLLDIDIHMPQQPTEQHYSLVYDTTALPSYNSKQTDNWDFYNGKYYGNVAYENLYAYRTPDETKSKAEVLTRINYPTGGSTEFEYELHSYSKIANQFPFEVINSSGSAGGLRVKRIIDLNGADTAMVRSFLYVDSTNTCSGILSGKPIYHVSGKEYDQWDVREGTLGNSHLGDELTTYILASEVMMNMLSTTTGNHVTYSAVKEVFGDGGATYYYYTNHDTSGCLDEGAVRYVDNFDYQVLNNAFNSKSLFRGLLLEKDEYNSTGNVVQKEINTYNLSDNDYLKSINEVNILYGHLLRATLYKVFTGFPYLEKRTIISYSDADDASTTETDFFTYSGRLLTNHKKVFHGTDTVETKIKYSGQISSYTYNMMKASGIIATPIEALTLRNGKIIGGSLVEWRRNSLNNGFVPWKEYKLQLSEPLNHSSFTPYDGQNRDNHYGAAEIEYTQVDSLSNITQFIGRDGVPVSVIWGYGGLYPIARITGITNSSLETTYNIKMSYPSFLPWQIEEALRTAGEKIDSWRWDPLRGVTRRTDASGRTISFMYDSAGRLILSTDENGRAISSQSYKYHQAQ